MGTDDLYYDGLYTMIAYFMELELYEEEKLMLEGYLDSFARS